MIARVPIVLSALMFAVAPARAAQLRYSTAPAARAAVDGVCDVYNARPKLIRHVALARVHDAHGSGAWKISSDAAVARLAAGGSIHADFADVFSRDGKIVYATYTRGDVTGGGGGAREYCYINGKLARASTELVDASTDHAISRREYYDPRGVLFADTGSLVRDIAKRHDDTVPDPKPPTLDIVAYPTPPALPFYDAYRAALAGRLPAI